MLRLFVIAPASAVLVACAEPAPECVPTAGGPIAVVEGAAVTATLGCATEGEARPPEAWQVTGLPDGATFDPATATIAWVPRLDQAAVYTVELAVADEATTGSLRIAVADAFDAPGNVPPLDPVRYPDELGVPVIFVTPRPTSEDYAPVTVVFGGRVYAAEAKLRGASSLSYPKQSYTIKFPAGAYFHAPELGTGFPARKRIVLTSTFDDNSYLRQRLAYELWNRMDPGHVQIAAASAVVYLDGEFHGLYALTDHVDKHRFAAAGLAETGDVYKSINHDANFDLRQYDGDPKLTLHDGYTKKDGLPEEGQPGAFNAIDDLVDFVARRDDATFAAEVATRIHVPDFRDWYVFATYVLGSDSGGKNAYLYHDPAGGPWRYAPWDWNHSFGQAWETSRTGSDDWDGFTNKNRLFVRLLADPALGPTVAARYRELLAGPLGEGEVVALYDRLVAETAAVAARDWRAWRDAYRGFERWSDRRDLTEHPDEVAYVRTWLSERVAYLRTRFAP
jgi:spore coat protein H